MRTHELAGLLDGIATGFDAGLRKPVKTELENLAAFLRSLPDQTFKDLTSTVETAVYGDPRSAPSLIRRIQSRADLDDSGRAKLEKDLKATKAADLKKVYAEVKGVRPGSLSKAHLLEGILDTLDTTNANQSGDDAEPSAEVVQGHVERFDALKRNMRNMGYRDIPDALAPFRELAPDVLAAVVKSIGFNPERTPDANLNALKQVLEGVKSRHVASDRI